jgi:hypothetical protein
MKAIGTFETSENAHLSKQRGIPGEVNHNLLDNKTPKVFSFTLHITAAYPLNSGVYNFPKQSIEYFIGRLDILIRLYRVIRKSVNRLVKRALKYFVIFFISY